MSKLKAFAYILKNSLISIKYYKEVIKTTVSFSVKYYVLLCLILTLITVVGGILPESPKIINGVNTFVNDIANLYPQDLVLTMKSGELSVNQPQPITVKFPDLTDDEKKNIEKDSTQALPENILVIDSNGTVDNIKDYKTLILVNKVNALIYGNEKIEVYSLKDIPDGELTKQNFDDGVNKLKGYVQYIPLFLMGITAFGLLFYYLGIRIVAILLVALVLLVVGKVKNLQLPYSGYFKIAVHAATLPLILEALVTLAIGGVPIPMWFFVINTVIGVLAVMEIAKGAGNVGNKEIKEGEIVSK